MKTIAEGLVDLMPTVEVIAKAVTVVSPTEATNLADYVVAQQMNSSAELGRGSVDFVLSAARESRSDGLGVWK